MPGAVATATTANTSATPPIPSRVGQNCRIFDAVTLLLLAFVTSCNPCPYYCHVLQPRRAMLVRQNPPALAVSSALRLSEKCQQAARQLNEFPPPNPAAHTINTV